MQEQASFPVSAEVGTAGPPSTQGQGTAMGFRDKQAPSGAWTLPFITKREKVTNDLFCVFSHLLLQPCGIHWASFTSPLTRPLFGTGSC